MVRNRRLQTVGRAGCGSAVDFVGVTFEVPSMMVDARQRTVEMRRLI